MADGTIVGVAVGVGVGVGLGAGVAKSSSSSSFADVESLGADEADGPNVVPTDNVLVVTEVELLVAELTVAEAAGVGIGWRCFR